MTSSSLFPPKTKEVQFDEKWSFVGKKQKNCDESEEGVGDCWDHVAYDAENRLVLETAAGKRSRRKVRRAVRGVKRRTGGRPPRLFTTDEFSAYKEELLDAYGVAETVEPTGRPGRPRTPRKEPPPDLLYATVHKTRKNGKVVKVEARLQFGTEEMLKEALRASLVSREVNTSFLERENGTDRLKNSRKVRKTYCFSKDWNVHVCSGYFTMYSYNFCWPVRTLRQEVAPRRFEDRTPAMAAELTDHVWSLREWLTFPAKTANLN